MATIDYFTIKLADNAPVASVDEPLMLDISVLGTQYATEIEYFYRIDITDIGSIYTAKARGSISVDIADIIRTQFPEVPFRQKGTDKIVPVEPYEQVLQVGVYLSVDQMSKVSNGVAVTRGVASPAVLPADGNFLAVARPGGNTVVVRETEMLPVMFFAGEHGVNHFQIRAVGPNETVDFSYTGEDSLAAYLIDFEAIRFSVFDGHITLCNIFEIWGDENAHEPLCRYVIERSEPCRERYYLRYLNRWGMWERIEVNGALTYKATESESGDYKVYNVATSRFSRRKDRQAQSFSVTIKAKVENREREDLLNEALMSGDIYLEGFGDAAMRVISASVVEGSAVNDSPVVREVRLELSDELTATPGISTAKRGVPRIHRDEFRQEFN